MKVLVLDENHPILIEKLKKNGFGVDEDYSSDKQKVEEIISKYDGIIIRSRFPIDKSFLSKAKSLKFIGRVGAGLENIDEKFAQQQNINLFNAPEGNSDALGEHAIGMLLFLMQRLKIADNEVRNGIWKREENRGDELMGKTVGIIGYGNMGKAFAKRLKGFQVNTICYDILPNIGDEHANQVDLKILFNEVDILSIHTPLTDSTKLMINQSFINQFKKQFYFINTARGKCASTKDIVEALKRGKIKGACLDVLEYEPSSFENFFEQQLSDDFKYLIQSEKVVITPHIAGWTIQSKEKLATFLADKIVKYYSNTFKT